MFGQLVEKLSVFSFEVAYLCKMAFLNSLQSSYFSFVKFFFFESYLSYLGFTAVHRIFQDVIHISEALCDVIMNSFKYRGNVSVKMIKVGNKFNEAKIYKCILATDNATIDLLFNS